MPSNCLWDWWLWGACGWVHRAIIWDPTSSKTLTNKLERIQQNAACLVARDYSQLALWQVSSTSTVSQLSKRSTNNCVSPSCTRWSWGWCKCHEINYKSYIFDSPETRTSDHNWLINRLCLCVQEPGRRNHMYPKQWQMLHTVTLQHRTLTMQVPFLSKNY